MTNATTTHVSYWLHPEVIRGFIGFRKWFAVAIGRSTVRHHLEVRGDDVLCEAKRHGATLNILGRFTVGCYIERSGDWLRLRAPESSLSLAVATSGDQPVPVEPGKS